MEPSPKLAFGIRLTVAYDGGGFSGFADQPGQRTVAGVLAEAAAQVSQHPVLIRGASRTDAGVHAEGQVVAFATARELAPARWLLALNRYLPEDVAVREAEACPPDFEPRFAAVDKTYRYLFHLGAARDPLVRKVSWHLGKAVRKRTLALGAMRDASELLIGTHDFRAFRSAADTRENTVRTLHEVTLKEQHGGHPELLAFEVRGAAFMLNMVRILAGTVLEVGLGRITVEEVRELLAKPGERRDAGMTAPAHGLTLVRVSTRGSSRRPGGAGTTDS
jgi:tRNA pseudouridine38-40 synthase